MVCGQEYYCSCVAKRMEGKMTIAELEKEIDLRFFPHWEEPNDWDTPEFQEEFNHYVRRKRELAKAILRLWEEKK